MTKAEDDKDFMARWIPYGKRLKAKGDGFGIDWRKMTFEQYEAAIAFAEEWAKPEGEMEHA